MALPERFQYMRHGEQVAAALKHYTELGMLRLTRSGDIHTLDMGNGLSFRGTVMPSGAHLYEVVATSST